MMVAVLNHRVFKPKTQVALGLQGNAAIDDFIAECGLRDRPVIPLTGSSERPPKNCRHESAIRRVLLADAWNAGTIQLKSAYLAVQLLPRAPSTPRRLRD
jgi:hypothetical protein